YIQRAMTRSGGPRCKKHCCHTPRGFRRPGRGNLLSWARAWRSDSKPPSRRCVSPCNRQPSASWPSANPTANRLLVQDSALCCLMRKDLPEKFSEAAPRLRVERLGGQLAKQPPVSRGELAGVAEAPALGDLRHGHRVRGRPQLLTDPIEPNRLEIGHRAQATDLLERIVQRPLAHGEFPTKVEHGRGASQVGPHVIFGA